MRLRLMPPILKLCLAGGLFMLGAGFHKYKPFPYPQLKSLAQTLRGALGKTASDASSAKAGQYSQTGGEADFTKRMDTILLPLQASGVNLSVLFPFPKSAGAMAVVKDSVVIMDWMGGAYRYDQGKVSRLDFPPLPNHVDEFARDLPPLFPGFRVHDVAWLADTNQLAVAYEAYDPGSRQTRLMVSAITLDRDSLQPAGSYQTLFQGDLVEISREVYDYAAKAGGGRLLYTGPDRLLLTAGDYGLFDPRTAGGKLAQNPASTYGKIFELTPSTGGRRIVSTGHRNPQGLCRTSKGELYSTEHGPNGGDELNLIKEGANYGWPEVGLGVNYQGFIAPMATFVGAENAAFPGEHNGFEHPVYAWMPSVGVGNLIQIHGFDRRWDGDLLVASLKASSLYRLRIHQGNVIYSEPIWIGERIRDLEQLPDGSIVLWTDSAKLWVLHLDRTALAADQRSAEVEVPKSMLVCMTCHHYGPTNPLHAAPTLTGLPGRKVASDDFGRYSEGLKAVGGEWNKERLAQYIADPNGFAPGALMPKLEIKPDDLKEIVDFLESGQMP